VKGTRKRACRKTQAKATENKGGADNNENGDDPHKKSEAKTDSKDRNENGNDKKSSIRLPLKAGRVTGFPKDLASAPQEIRLSKKLLKRSYEA